MSLTVNAISEVVGSHQFFTGILPMSVIAVNPTMAELHSMGVMVKDEPIYFSHDQERNCPKMRVEFHLLSEATQHMPAVRARITYFLRFQYVNNLFMNKHGRYSSNKAFLVDKNSIDEFKDLTPKQKMEIVDTRLSPYVPEQEESGFIFQAMDGEADLIMFAEALCCIKPGDNCFLKKRFELFGEGYIDELADMVRDTFASNNKVLVLLGVADGKYQQAYKMVAPVYRRDFTKIWKDYCKQKQWLKADFGQIDTKRYNADDFVLRIWEPLASQEVIPAPARTAAPAAAPAPAPAAGPAKGPAGPAGPAGPGSASPYGKTTAAPQHIASDDDNDLPF